jgi:hypothetical protein
MPEILKNHLPWLSTAVSTVPSAQHLSLSPGPGVTASNRVV